MNKFVRQLGIISRLNDDPDMEELNLEKESLLKLLESKYSEAFDLLKQGVSIRRSFSTKYEKPFIQKPVERVSQSCEEVGNFYTLMIDNDPSFEGFPKRSRSFICHAGLLKGQRGFMAKTSYYVFPENGTRVGICDSDDIWYLKIKVDSGSSPDLKVVMNQFVKFIRLNDPNIFFKYMTYDDLVNLTIDPEKIEKERLSTFQKTLLNLLIHYDGKMINVFKRYLSPEILKLKVATLSDLKSNLHGVHEQEVWFESPSLFVEKELFNEIFPDFEA